MMRVVPGLAAATLALATAACGGPGVSAGVMAAGTPVVLGGALLTLPQTGKLPTDHLASWATGRDCSVLHYEQEGAYCKDAPIQIDHRSLYCFKTIGAVECHQRPDPYYGGEQTLASPPPRPIERD